MLAFNLMRLARFSLAGAFLLLGISAYAQTSSICEQLSPLTKAERIITKNNVVMSHEAVNLPDVLPLSARNAEAHIRYILDTTPCAASTQSVSLYLYRVGAPFIVSALGQKLTSSLPAVGLRDSFIMHASNRFSHNGRVPAVFPIPAGARAIEISLQTLPFMPAGLTPVYLGGAEVSAIRQSADYSALATGSDLVASISILLGSIAILLLFFRRNDVGLRWFATGSVIWGVRNLAYLNPLFVGDGFITEMLLSYGIVVSGSALLAASLYACKATSARILWFIRTLLWVITIALILGFLFPLLATAARAIGFFSVMGLLVWATWLVVKAVKTSIPGVTKPVQYAMVVGVAMQLVFGLHDFGIVLGLRPPTSPALVFWGYSCWVFALAAFSSARVVEALNRAQNANVELEDRVAQKNAELKTLYDDVQEEKIRGERARLNREIHDGIGAQLMTALRGVERGALSQDQITESLQDGLDELRLLMDSADIGHDLHGALFSWRNRWEPRLNAVDLSLRWHVSEDIANIKLSQQVILQLIRILQESVANVVKHAKASQINVNITTQVQALVLTITDDGIGIADSAFGASHRGLKHMAQRATLIGASYSIQKLEPPGHGTQVTLKLPLEA